MANGKPAIYIAIQILSAGGAKGSGNSYDLPVQDEISTTTEKVSETVEDGQTVLNALDGTIEVFTYDLDVLTDSNVQDDATIVNKAKILLEGATGTDDLAMDNVRIHAHEDRQTTDRIGARVMATKRATSDPMATS